MVFCLFAKEGEYDCSFIFCGVFSSREKADSYKEKNSNVNLEFYLYESNIDDELSVFDNDYYEIYNLEFKKEVWKKNKELEETKKKQKEKELEDLHKKKVLITDLLNKEKNNMTINLSKFSNASLYDKEYIIGFFDDFKYCCTNYDDPFYETKIQALTRRINAEYKVIKLYLTETELENYYIGFTEAGINIIDTK